MEQNGLDLLAIINPKNGDRYSPNLYRWLKHRQRKHRAWTSRVYVDAYGVKWIGMIKPGLCFSGCRLMAVLCNGCREQSFAYLLNRKFTGGLVEIPDFWENYALTGRCAVDPEHTEHFRNDDTRWQYDGNHRRCLWCGEFSQILKKWQETVDREKWVAMPNKSLVATKERATTYQLDPVLNRHNGPRPESRAEIGV